MNDAIDCLILLKELFETYQNPALNSENESNNQKALDNSFEGMKPEENDFQKP